MTGAERSWASRYEINDVLRYARGSKSVGIEPGDYGTVVSINSAANLLTVDKSTDELATYDPRRLTGVNVYREVTQAFAAGDRIQFTAPDKSRRDGSFEEQQIQKQNLHELFSGLASLPVLRTDLVLQHHMLTDQQLNTAVVVTRTTPRTGWYCTGSADQESRKRVGCSYRRSSGTGSILYPFSSTSALGITERLRPDGLESPLSLS